MAVVFIKLLEVKLVSHRMFRSFEAAAEAERNRNIIVSRYYPPSSEINPIPFEFFFLDEYEKFLVHLVIEHKYIMISGYFNIPENKKYDPVAKITWKQCTNQDYVNV